MKRNTCLTPSVILIHLFFLCSCISIRPHAEKSGINLYESYFIKDQGTQYFIKPLEFQSKNKDELKADLTFRYNEVYAESSTVNFSIISAQNIKELDSLVFISGDCRSHIAATDHLFSERERKKIHSRFSGTVKTENFACLFKSENWIIHLYYPEGTMTFRPIPKTVKNINKIQYQVFSLL